MSEEVVKVTVTLPAAQVQKLRRLAQITNTSEAEVLNAAISLKDYVETEQLKGGKLLVEKPDRTFREVIVSGR